MALFHNSIVAEPARSGCVDGMAYRGGKKGPPPSLLPLSHVRVHVGLRVRTEYTFDPDAPLRLTANPKFVNAFAQKSFIPTG